MKAIIYTCLDNFGHQYTLVDVCPDERVAERIETACRLSTEIIHTEIVTANIYE